LRSLGVRITRQSSSSGLLSVDGSRGFSVSRKRIFVGGSGTTARFGISLAALCTGFGETIITCDDSLLKRPMGPLLDALSQLGVQCHSESQDERLPVVVKAGGIKGGYCEIEGSISSQFISSLLIACTRSSKKDVTIKVKNPETLVSEPYIDATLEILRYYGFMVDVTCISSGSRKKYREFGIRANQAGKSRAFRVPGDMSSAAALIGATLSARGSVMLRGVDLSLPQPDSEMLSVAKILGAKVRFGKRDHSLTVHAGILGNATGKLNFDMKSSPDMVPSVMGALAGLGRDVKIRNVGHLRYKESDRIRTLSEGLTQLGIGIREGSGTIEALADYRSQRGFTTSSERKPIVVNPRNDHRMLMAFTIAGLSGRLGAFSILDPDCVKKSYPEFISDINLLCAGGRSHRRQLIVTSLKKGDPNYL
jgi:3-phosphoshikimate 1-carboxyvinyltransferase